MKEKIKRFLHYLYVSIKKPEMEVLPGNLAFFFMMMIIPLLTIIGTVIANLDITDRSLTQTIYNNFPNNIADLIISIMGEGSSSVSVWAILVGSLLLASNGTYSMIVTSNSIYGIEKSSQIKNRIKSVVLVIVLVLLFTLLLIIPVINSKVLEIAARLTKTDMSTNIYFMLYKVLKYPILFVFVFVFVKILYKYSPRAILVGSLLLASNGTYSMIVTSNSIYGIEKSSQIKNRIKSVVLVIVLVLLFTLLLIIPVINSKVLEIAARLTKTDMSTNIYFMLYKVLKYPILFVFVFVFVKILYKYSPSGGNRKKTSYGAVFTSVLLMISTWGYSIYIEYFSDFETLYGGISNLLFLMLWIQLISYIFVLGMNLNAAREKMILEDIKKDKTNKKERET